MTKGRPLAAHIEMEIDPEVSGVSSKKVNDNLELPKNFSKS
jgi:hypothetical protein